MRSLSWARAVCLGLGGWPSQCSCPSCSCSSGPSTYFCPCSCTGQSHLPTPTPTPTHPALLLWLQWVFVGCLSYFFFFSSRGHREEGFRWTFVSLPLLSPTSRLPPWRMLSQDSCSYLLGVGKDSLVGSVEKEPARGYKIPIYLMPSGAALSLASPYLAFIHLLTILLWSFLMVFAASALGKEALVFLLSY